MSKSANPSRFSSVVEECEDCGRITPHEAAIELRTESDRERNAEFSREPYRISECQLCGNETTRRMNNA